MGKTEDVEALQLEVASLREKLRRKQRKHAMQPVVWDGRGVIRFQKNPIVTFLLETSPNDLNALVRMSEGKGWTRADWAHFSQLHGYSVSGCPYLSHAEAARAAERVIRLLEREDVDPALKNGG